MSADDVFITDITGEESVLFNMFLRLNRGFLNGDALQAAVQVSMHAVHVCSGVCVQHSHSVTLCIGLTIIKTNFFYYYYIL